MSAIDHFFVLRIRIGTVGFLLGVILLLNPLVGHSATTASVILQWDPNTESDLAGYKVYHGKTSGIYADPINVGKNTKYQFENLELNQTHYFSVTAYDKSGRESEPSSEVYKFISGSSTEGEPLDNSVFRYPPGVASPAPNSLLTATTVTFTGAHTNEDFQHWVNVGTQAGGSDLYAGTVDRNHAFTVTGLPTSGTIYVRYFTRKSSASAWESHTHTYTMKVGSTSSSSPSSFPPPVLSPAPNSLLTATTVTFTGAHTNEDFQHWVNVGTQAGGSDLYAGTVDRNHAFTVTGLPTSGTIYVRYFTRKSSASAWESHTHTYTMKVK